MATTFSLQPTNPTLKAAREFEADWAGADQATLAGVADKTFLLVGLTTLAGAGAYALLPATHGIMLLSCVAAAIVGLGVGWILAGNPAQAKVLAPIYALVEGVFLGLLTRALDLVLLSQGISAEVVGGSLALPAFVITISCVASMLVLYRAGVIRPTQRFKAVLGTLTLGIMLAYLAMFVLSFFGVQVPFLSLGSAFEAGRPALIGLALNAGILVVASLWLVVDFGAIEDIVASGKPKSLEWYGAFALLVTLAWIYYEAVKLAFRLAMLFGRRR